MNQIFDFFEYMFVFIPSFIVSLLVVSTLDRVFVSIFPLPASGTECTRLSTWATVVGSCILALILSHLFNRWNNK